MEHRTLGRTGMQVSPLCLGTMMFGRMGNPDHDESIRAIHRALDAGINFVDTADIYSRGESEEIVGKAIKGRRDDVVLATKFTLPMGESPNQRGHSRKWVMQEVEASLTRLGTDHIDLYQAHRPDATTDIDELMSTLTILVEQGKVRYIGSSTFSAAQIVKAQWAADKRGKERFLCEQPPYSIFVREIERDILPTCQEYGMGVIPWSPLAGGWLSGKFRLGKELPTDGRAGRMPQRYDPEQAANKRRYEAIEELEKVAADAGMPLIHLALAFVISHPAVSAAIIGPRTFDQLEGQLGVLEMSRLDDDVLDQIDRIVRPGTNIDPRDGGYAAPALANPALRRR